MLRILSLMALTIFAVIAFFLWVAAGMATTLAPHMVGELLHQAKSAGACALLSLAIFSIATVWFPARA